MAITKFGQEVVLTVEDTEGNLVLDASGLRVDFDVRKIDGFSRASFTIYNLSNENIGKIKSTGTNGDRYVTLKTRLHDGKLETIAKSFFVSNVVDERKLPNIVVTLYCTDLIRRKSLERQVDLSVKRPNLERSVSQIMAATGFVGNINYLSFPDDLERLSPSKRRVRPFQGNASQCINELANEYNFFTFTNEGSLDLMYKPDLDNVGNTSLNSKKADIILDSNNMRANPLIGIASLSVTSNLDSRIQPTSVLDISKLIAAGTSTEEDSLQIVEGYLKGSVVGYSKYQAFAVQHKGSNYTKDWHTIVTALSPTEGKIMPSNTWFRP